MARFLSLRINFVDVPPDRGKGFAGDLFERRAIDDPNFGSPSTPAAVSSSSCLNGPLPTSPPPVIALTQLMRGPSVGSRAENTRHAEQPVPRKLSSIIRRNQRRLRDLFFRK